MKRLNNKRECYESYNLGLFGNRALTWNSYDEIIKSGWCGMVCIRGKNIPRVEVRYNIPIEKIRENIQDLEKRGYPERILTFNQSMPDNFLSIQGEIADYIPGFDSAVTDYITGFNLTYTLVQKPMNQALKEDTKFASGLVAKMILKSAMDPSSFSDLSALFEIYPDSAIEFSTYEINVGDIPNRNTVFWEVRNY